MSLTFGPTSVVLATDSSLIGDGLVSLLADVEGVSVVGRTADYLELFELIGETRPDATIVSMRSPVASLATSAVATSAVVAVHRLRHEFPRLGVVIVSDHDDGSARELLRDGAARIAYLMDERLLDLEMVLGALHEVCAGRSVLDPGVVDALVSHYESVPVDELSHREPDVLARISKGLSNQAIASELHISVKAIEKDVTAIFRKLNLLDRTLVDRRVSAAIRFLRTRSNPFGPEPQAPETKEEWSSVAVPDDVDGFLTASFADRLGGIDAGCGSGSHQPAPAIATKGRRRGGARA
jgi:DNA-binding NarL/FixJ family response regulator